MSVLSSGRQFIAVVEAGKDGEFWEDDFFSACDSSEQSTCSRTATSFCSSTPAPSSSHSSGTTSRESAKVNLELANDGSGLVTMGSQHHSVGRCTPCKFFRSRRGCLNGAQCKLCHYPHPEMTTSAIRKFARNVAIQKAQMHAPFDVDAQSDISHTQSAISEQSCLLQATGQPFRSASDPGCSWAGGGQVADYHQVTRLSF
mmetsp:Transcript_2990/g.9000  ORF Transcript_2990/g.9000 Transcript_2990/m.9000 type:complete len:201 (-) Transcript_2990:290-892(-)